MKMKPFLTPPYLSLFLQIVAVFVAVGSSPIYTPVEDITLTCGSSGNQFNRYDNRTWRGDINSKLSPIGNTSQVREAPPSSSSMATQVPYTTARLSHSEFTYMFNQLTAGPKFIRLYIYPASYPNFYRSKAHFSVKANYFTLLDDFNASATADAYGVDTLYREFCLNIDEEQSLNITFTPSKVKDAYALINGIEIVSMPTHLYYSNPGSAGADYVGSDNLKPFISSTAALEMVYRLNIGGSSGSNTEDTGMYRKWESEDKAYLVDSSLHFSILRQNNSIELNFATIPKYTAPKEVYQSGRSMGMNKTISKSYNLTWEFEVDPFFFHLVRLHFCEFEPNITQYGDLVFQIYIGNKTVEDRADIIQWSGGNGIPVYRDYIVYMSNNEDEKKASLFLALASFQKDWLTSYGDAILNGLEIFKLISSNDSNVADPSPIPNSPSLTPRVKSPKSLNKWTPMLAIVAGAVSSTLAFSVLRLLVFRQGWKVKDSESNHSMNNSKMHRSYSPTYLGRKISLAEIKAATQNFNDSFIIGVGGFGNVYRGCIDGGATLVAIKRLKPDSSQGAHEFKTEIEMLSQLRHRHLVSLIGCCNDQGEMILVYDYMALGSLSDHLYNTDNPPLLWKQRLQICIGAARGLQYLHSGTKGTIIHRDVKSTNILLDEKWVAKVSDFGLSKMGTANMLKNHISTVVKGSFGYLDPEYYRTQRLSVKSDVYSFGVVLCEILCARPAVIQTEDTNQINLAEWTTNCYENGELDQIIDPNLRGKIAAECLNKFAEIAISCINDNGNERPSMTDVVRELEVALQIHQRGEEDINSTRKNGESETRSREQSFLITDSIKCISVTIFSEINNPSGRR